MKRILSGAGIKTRVTKSASSDTGECTHGLKLSDGDMYKAAMVLRNHAIEYTVENDIPR